MTFTVRTTLSGHLQYSIGQLIHELEKLGPEALKLPVYFDFANTYPIDVMSYRGSYVELGMAFGHLEWINRYVVKPQLSGLALVTMLQDAIAPFRTFVGWKGGEYRMTVDTPIWIAQDGETSHTVIVMVVCEPTEIVLHTDSCEF